MAWRIVPFLTGGYFLASLDRVNVGFAALRMNADINLSAKAFGFGIGLFFVAYCLFAVPGNLIMERIGAAAMAVDLCPRRWHSSRVRYGLLRVCGWASRKQEFAPG